MILSYTLHSDRHSDRQIGTSADCSHTRSLDQISPHLWLNEGKFKQNEELETDLEDSLPSCFRVGLNYYWFTRLKVH